MLTPPESRQSNVDNVVNCHGCNRSVISSECYKSKVCNHHYCSECCLRMFETLLQDSLSCDDCFYCPAPECGEPFSNSIIDSLLAAQMSQSDNEKPTFDCVLCSETTLVEYIFQSRTCLHEACRECARKYVQSLIEESKSLKCFQSDCEIEWAIDDVELLVDCSEYEKLQKVLFQKAVVGCVQCPKADCRGLAEVVPPCSRFRCPQCNYQMCVSCKYDYHPTVTCDQYRQWLEENGQADERFNDYVKTTKVQVCPSCRQGVEKKEGCNHMTCRCQTHFCYLCGKEFKSKAWEEHDKCPLFHYPNIQ